MRRNYEIRKIFMNKVKMIYQVKLNNQSKIYDNKLNNQLYIKKRVNQFKNKKYKKCKNHNKYQIIIKRDYNFQNKNVNDMYEIMNY